MIEWTIVCNLERIITIGTSLGKFDNANIIHSDVSYVLTFFYHYVWMYAISQWNPCVHFSFWSFFRLLISCETTTINCNFTFWMTCAKVFWNQLLLIYYRWPNWNGDGDLEEDLKFSYSNRSVYIWIKLRTYFVVVWSWMIFDWWIVRRVSVSHEEKKQKSRHCRLSCIVLRLCVDI